MRPEAAARRLGQGQVVLASLQVRGDERSVDSLGLDGHEG